MPFVRFPSDTGTLDSAKSPLAGHPAFTLEPGCRLPALSPSTLHLPLPPPPIPTSARGVSTPHRYGTACCGWHKPVESGVHRHVLLPPSGRRRAVASVQRSFDCTNVRFVQWKYLIKFLEGLEDDRQSKKSGGGVVGRAGNCWALWVEVWLWLWSSGIWSMLGA